MAVVFQGHALNNAGEAISGVTIDIFTVATAATESTASSSADVSTTSDATGLWTATTTAEGQFDIRIKNGEEYRWLRAEDKVQFEALDLRTSGLPMTIENSTDAASNEVMRLRGNNATRADGDEIYISGYLDDDAGNSHEFGRVYFEATDVSNGSEDGQIRFGVSVGDTMTDAFVINSSVGGAISLSLDDAQDFIVGTGNDAGFRWDTGDADNHTFTIGLGDSNQGLHITDLGAMQSPIDWNIAATTHPNVYIHSNTTPATDYLRLGDHDGTLAYIDVVGGTTLHFQIVGNTEVSITASGLTLPANSDLLFTGTTGTNDIVLTNGLADALSITDGSADVIVIDTSTAGNVITFTSAITASGATITGPSGTWDSGGMDIATGDSYAIASTNVLTATALGSAVAASSLTSVGTLTALTMGGDINLDGSNIDNGGVIFLKEQADADGDVAGSGQLWVDTATPNVLMFTNDAGTDFTIAHNATTTLSSLVTVGALNSGTITNGFGVRLTSCSPARAARMTSRFRTMPPQPCLMSPLEAQMLRCRLGISLWGQPLKGYTSA